jgi:hypothetical protein
MPAGAHLGEAGLVCTMAAGLFCDYPTAVEQWKGNGVEARSSNRSLPLESRHNFRHRTNTIHEIEKLMIDNAFDHALSLRPSPIRENSAGLRLPGLLREPASERILIPHASRIAQTSLDRN